MLGHDETVVLPRCRPVGALEAQEAVEAGHGRLEYRLLAAQGEQLPGIFPGKAARRRKFPIRRRVQRAVGSFWSGAKLKSHLESAGTRAARITNFPAWLGINNFFSAAGNFLREFDTAG